MEAVIVKFMSKDLCCRCLTLYISPLYLLNRFVASTAETILTPEALHTPAHQLMLNKNIRYSLHFENHNKTNKLTVTNERLISTTAPLVISKYNCSHTCSVALLKLCLCCCWRWEDKCSNLGNCPVRQMCINFWQTDNYSPQGLVCFFVCATS